MLGSVIGNYKVSSRFGEGGMGELFIGRHTRLAREVIIKTIRTEDFSPRQIEHLRERLEREAFVQSQLDHPNIVRVYDFIASGDMTCIVMEYVPGRDLRRMIASLTSPIPTHHAIKLFKQVLAAIDYAHHFVYSDRSGQKHQGIIHRDLKPANILVSPEDVVKVTDFGIVKVRGVKGGTQVGFNPGTPEYMSPEQARGREIDQRSDIYSLGVVFYEMLTRHVPFEDDGSSTSDYEIRRGHIELPVPPLSTYNPEISPEIEKIVCKALEKNPDDRYQTARQFLDAIEEFEKTGTATIPDRLPGSRQTLVHEGRGPSRSDVVEVPAIDLADTVITDPSNPATALPSYSNPPVHNGAPIQDVYRRRGLISDPMTPKSKRPMVIAAATLGVLTLILAYNGNWRWLIPPGSKPATNAPPGMLAIKRGTFTMGRVGGDEYETPAHPVTVEPFFIDEHEVTNEQYKEFVRAQPGRQAPSHWKDGEFSPGDARLPVVNVNWFEAKDYCESLGKRLPTEAEWEYAARGRGNYLYPYGNNWKPKYSCASEEPDCTKPKPVGSYPEGRSPFKVLDMAGNVAEWTASDYEPYPGSTARKAEDTRVIRGGAFNVPASEQTATDRRFDSPNQSLPYLGFRCAMSLK
jgi:eukaryotic-like serine/threonine-protein kinase